MSAVRPKLRAVDLFSGCGGLTTGLRGAGFDVLLAVDNDPLAIKCYRLNHRKTTLWHRDIKTVSGEEILSTFSLKPGELDLLAGCPPCQGFSSLRTLNGSRRVVDVRNDLISDFGRLALELRPKTVLMENVPGLGNDLRLKVLANRLRRSGYKVRWKTLNAADYGVPQRRRRLILLAALDGHIDFPEPESSPTFFVDVLGDIPKAGQSGDPAHDHSENRSDKVKLIISKIPKDGGSRSDLEDSEQLQCHKRTRGFFDVYGRMRLKEVAPTITSGFLNPSKGRFLHPTENRTITVREGAILQSFPPRYRFPMKKGKYPVAALIGNAVPPVFAAAQARSIRLFLESRQSS
jgi:DNA (cytosine-5)-methyltransferase 1